MRIKRDNWFSTEGLVFFYGNKAQNWYKKVRSSGGAERARRSGSETSRGDATDAHGDPAPDTSQEMRIIGNRDVLESAPIRIRALPRDAVPSRVYGSVTYPRRFLLTGMFP